MLGPIDYVIVGFEGNKFNGSILNAIGDAIDKGIIRLIALTFMRKDKDGKVSAVDIADLGDDYATSFSQRYKSDNTLVTKEDVDEMSELVKNDTAVGMLVIEQTWAKPLKKAILDANGELVAEGRIHPDAAAELETNKGE
jgi:hypothetical protein